MSSSAPRTSFGARKKSENVAVDLLIPTITSELVQILPRSQVTSRSRVHWRGGHGSYITLPSNHPRLPIPSPGTVLFSGSIDLADTQFADTQFPGGMSAHLWWPDDHAWCVATDIDLMTTHLGPTPVASTPFSPTAHSKRSPRPGSKHFRYAGFSCTASARALIMREPIFGGLGPERDNTPIARLRTCRRRSSSVSFGTRTITTGEVVRGCHVAVRRHLRIGPVPGRSRRSRAPCSESSMRSDRTYR